MDPPNAAAQPLSTLEASRARVGSVVCGKWRIDELLGVGGMASVFAATHRNGRRAALKILHRELCRDVPVRERFLREGYVGNKIQHVGRVEVQDNDETEDGEPLLVMELLIGETLDSRWKRFERKIPVDDALAIADALLDVLVACHAAGIIHRDLKPANIFLTDDGRLKVLDFGVAQLREATTEATRAGTALGTPAFMAPEQARGLGDKLDGRADIFSVGALLYALVSGTRLHKGRTSDEALVLAATQPAPSLARVAPELPIEVVALVDKALAWDRRNRFADAAEMQRAVREARRRSPSLRPAASEISSSARSGERTTSSAQPREVDPALADDDRRIEKLRGVFKQLERLFPAVRQYGFEHPEARRRLDTAFDEIVATIAEEGTSTHWVVRPYAFVRGERTIWEPTAPLDAIPYALFDGGVRRVRLRAGLTSDELHEFLALWVLDPQRDFAPEDDFCTRLWELGLPHVEVEAIDGFAEGNAADRAAFFDASADLERVAAQAAARAARAEALAMPVSIDGDAQLSGVRQWLGAVLIDPTARRALETQLTLTQDRWRERYGDALVEALIATQGSDDLAPLLRSIERSAVDRVRLGEAALVEQLHAQAMKAVETRLAAGDRAHVQREVGNAFAGSAIAQRCLESLSREGVGAPTSEARAATARLLATALSNASGKMFGPILEALQTLSGEAKSAAAAYLLQSLGGNERLLATVAITLDADLAGRFVERLKGDAATIALDAFAQHPDANVRLAAVVARARSPEQLRQELARAIESETPEGRRLALQRAIDARARELVPLLARRAEDAGFHALPVDERRALLTTLHALATPRAEAIAIGLLSQKNMLRSDARDQSRFVALQHLADHGRSQAAIDAVSSAAKAWWGASDELKVLATNAARAITARMQGPASGSDR